MRALGRMVQEARPDLPHGAANAASASRTALGSAARFLSPAGSATGRAGVDGDSFGARVLRNLAIQDWVIAGYFTVLLGALAFGTGPGREGCLIRVGIDAAIFAVVVALTRGDVIKIGSRANGLVYRFVVFNAVFLSYFQLRHILPAVSHRVVDAQLYALDLRIFGFEPAIAWDRFVTPVTTEWFAFFYFSYFVALVVHMLPMIFGARDAFRLNSFALGVLFVFCIGNIGYMLVPGYGPYHTLHFAHPLEGGRFWAMVRATVDAGGAQKDIFPSLHTAFPTYFALFSYTNRRALPFKYTWPVVAFFASQIIIATMFLRWHWVIDVVAGLTLAFSAERGGRLIASWERERRARDGLPPVFDPLF